MPGNVKYLLCKRVECIMKEKAYMTKHAENVLNCNLVAEYSRKKMISDIIYIPTDEGWLYLAGVVDLYLLVYSIVAEPRLEYIVYRFMD